MYYISQPDYVSAVRFGTTVTCSGVWVKLLSMKRTNVSRYKWIAISSEYVYKAILRNSKCLIYKI